MVASLESRRSAWPLALAFVVAASVVLGFSEAVVSAERPDFSVDLPIPRLAPMLGARHPVQRFANHLVVGADGRPKSLHSDGLRPLETVLACAGEIPLWRERVQLYVDPSAPTDAVRHVLIHIPRVTDPALVVSTTSTAEPLAVTQRTIPIRIVSEVDETPECLVELDRHARFRDALAAVSHSCVTLLFRRNGEWDEYGGWVEPWLIRR